MFLFANFNSIKVQLERSPCSSEKVKFLDFNSIKVQLEPGFSFVSGLFALFQFHKGTIRTRVRRYPCGS